MTRDPNEFATRRLENIERLQRQLVASPDDRDAWLGLARVRVQQDRPAEALIAFEHGLWNLDPVEVTRELLESGWAWGDRAEADVTERLVAEVLAGASPSIGDRLRAHEPELRLRTAWLLWTQVGTPEELSAAAKRLLAALPPTGLAARDLPAFAQDSTPFATWSRAEVERTILGLDVSS